MPSMLLNMQPLIRFVRSAGAKRLSTYPRHLWRKHSERAEICLTERGHSPGHERSSAHTVAQTLIRRLRSITGHLVRNVEVLRFGLFGHWGGPGFASAMQRRIADGGSIELPNVSFLQ